MTDAAPHQLRPGVLHQLGQPLQGRAVGQEVIKQQHMVALVEIPLGHDDGEFLLLGEGVDGGGVLVASRLMDCAFLANTTGALPK